MAEDYVAQQKCAALAEIGAELEVYQYVDGHACEYSLTSVGPERLWHNRRGDLCWRGDREIPEAWADGDPG
jgi:hypothetical protein